MRKFKLVW